jgi:hypothetical protein
VPLSPPPRNKAGEVIPHDHSQIAQDDRIIRRISDYHVVPDSKAPSGRRISTAAYQESSGGCGGMSVDLERSIICAGIDPRAFVTTPQFMGSVWFTAGCLRSERLQVGFDPLPQNAHHGEVWGVKDKHKRKLQKAAAWFVPIPGVDLS